MGHGNIRAGREWSTPFGSVLTRLMEDRNLLWPLEGGRMSLVYAYAALTSSQVG